MSTETTPLGLLERLEALCGRLPTHFAVGDDRRTLSYAQLLSQIQQAAAVLGQHCAGNSVLLPLASGIELTVWQLAVLKAGGIAVPLPSRLKRQEVQKYLRAFTPDLVCLGAHSGDVLQGIPPGLPVLHLPAADLSKKPLFSEKPSRSLPPETRLVQFTSGSTGTPKVLLLSEANLAAGLEGALDALDVGGPALCPLPQAHAMGNAVALEFLLSGNGIRYASSPMPGEHLECLKRYASTWLVCSPSYARLLLRAESFKHETLPSLCRIMLGSDWIDRLLIERLFQRFPDAAILCRYGQSEAVGPAFYHRLQPGQYSSDGFIGTPVKGCRVLSPKAPATEGELVLHTKAAASWLLDETGTLLRLAEQENALRTGDHVEVCPQGLRLLGRQSQFIKSGGHRISPVEVEEVLRSHEGVAECAVCGLPDEQLGQKIVAAIEPKAGCSPKTLELTRHCTERLSPHKVPRQFVLLATLPKTPSGKVARSGLGPLLEHHLQANHDR